MFGSKQLFLQHSLLIFVSSPDLHLSILIKFAPVLFFRAVSGSELTLQKVKDVEHVMRLLL